MIQNQFNGPLFVIGSPRSGTSLLRLMLTNHSQIIIPPECGFVIWLYEKYADWQLSDCNIGGRLGAFICDLFECKKFDTWMLSPELISMQIEDAQPKTYAELCRVVYASFSMVNRKKLFIWGDKNNFYLNHLDELLCIFKNARFLHLVRDGRDVACSYREVMEAKSASPYAPNLKTEIIEIATEWSCNVLKVDAFISGMPKKQVMTIRYEDLVSEPESIVSEVCKWLNIPFEAEMFNFYEQNKRHKLEPELTMDWKQRTLEPISDDTVGRYKKLLSNEEQDGFLNIAKNAMHRFSYY